MTVEWNDRGGIYNTRIRLWVAAVPLYVISFMLKKFLHGCVVGLGAAAIAVGCWLAGWLNQPENMLWRWRVRVFARKDPAVRPGQGHPARPEQPRLGQDGESLVLAVAARGLRARSSASASAAARRPSRSIGSSRSRPSTRSPMTRRWGPRFKASVRRRRTVPRTKSGEVTNWPPEIPASRLVIQGLDAWLKTARARRVFAPRASFPIPEVATNAALLGDVSDQPDEDGVFRRTSLFQIFDGKPVPSLGLAAYLAANKGEELKVEPGWLSIGGKRVPIDSSGRAILYFRGRRGMHETYSAASIIQSELRLQEGGKPPVDPSVFKDAYVFFGSSAAGLLDLRPTPISKVLPGVEIHATALDNLLSILFLRDAPKEIVVGDDPLWPFQRDPCYPQPQGVAERRRVRDLSADPGRDRVRGVRKRILVAGRRRRDGDAARAGRRRRRQLRDRGPAEGVHQVRVQALPRPGGHRPDHRGPVAAPARRREARTDAVLLGHREILVVFREARPGRR